MTKSKVLGIIFLIGFLSGCGNTVVGVGQDIQRWGENWNDSSVEKVVSVEKETK